MEPEMGQTQSASAGPRHPGNCGKPQCEAFPSSGSAALDGALLFTELSRVAAGTRRRLSVRGGGYCSGQRFLGAWGARAGRGAAGLPQS